MNAFEVVTRACGVGVLAALCLALIGKQSGGYGMAIRIGGATLLFGILAALLSGAIETLGELTVLADSSYAQEGYSVMLKGLGVALLSRFCADICRDCGESGLASGVESVGRTVIFSLSIPMLVDAIRLAGSALGAV